MEKVKETRARCKQLNDAADLASADEKPYFVINGKIMTKSSDGKLSQLKPSTGVGAGNGNRTMGKESSNDSSKSKN